MEEANEWSERRRLQSDYHERQSCQLCALHVLNNLFGRREFSKPDLDSICHELSPGSWINPHKSVFGLGNYDVNVLMAALQARGMEARWFDKRRWVGWKSDSRAPSPKGC